MTVVLLVMVVISFCDGICRSGVVVDVVTIV